MKKMLCLLTILALLCTLPLAVRAEAASVQVYWGDMNFAYTFGEIWNPKTHSYDAAPGKTIGWNHTTAEIRVENTFDHAVAVYLTFQKSGNPAFSEVAVALDRDYAVIPGYTAGEDNAAVFVLSISGVPSGAAEGSLGTVSVTHQAIPEEPTEDAPEAESIQSEEAAVCGALTVSADASAVELAEEGTQVTLAIQDAAGNAVPASECVLQWTASGDVYDMLLCVNSDSTVSIAPANPAKSFAAQITFTAEHAGSTGSCTVQVTYHAPAQEEPLPAESLAPAPVEAPAEPESEEIPAEEPIIEE